MKKIPAFILFLSLINICGFAQQVFSTTDSLMLNAEYEKALAFIDRNSNVNDPSQKILMQNKKAEALIHLGRFAEAEKILKSLLANNQLASSAYLQGITKTNI